MSTAVRDRGRWRPALDRPALAALLLGLAGFGYRLVLTLLTVPVSNSDEATFGLAALHIAAGREHPVFLYGQRYMGMAEAYLAAPLVAVAGPSWPVLRLPVLALWALFVFLAYRLTRRICAPWFAVLVVGLLALGPERVLRDQLQAVGGRPEVKPAVLAILLVAVGLADGRMRSRPLAAGVAGLLAGLAVWSDWLIVPYLAAAVLLLAWVLRRELLGWCGAALAAGFAVGAVPLIVDSLRAPPGQDSLSVVRRISGEAGAAPPLAERLRGGLLEGVPLATGLCPAGGCARWQQWFGVAYPLLLVAAAVLALVAYRRAAARPAGDRVGPAAQLALVAGAASTLAAYVRSPLAATDPLNNARYLSVLQLSLPVVLWPLWVAARHVWRGPAGAAGRLAGASATAALAGLVATALAATGLFVAGLGPLRVEERQARQLADVVRRAGLQAVYGEYWTCNRLVFETAEEVLCGVLDGRLMPGQNRYRPYWRQVALADRPGYVLVAGGPADRRLRELLGPRAGAALRAEVGRYRVYHPETAVRPWR
ncbi:hypothetical protein GA0070558_1205 [Micromonospora haikouensis]|uniref:4-amino-4-deoxy-L-arabinose transferase n=1 Tax=Micromonospora haikouensis TaxID=686309 RepID=A0A1C4WZH9_9ACTN|nr:hypothetical protein [Micromonospora haikouensis]SCF01613.1 hypothetical protein GA0070558_1205 [Micromonospora haikouensis]